MRWIIDRFLSEVCRRVATLRPRTIVDFGCGEGIVARELVRYLEEPFEYLGLDTSSASLGVAKEYNRDYPNLRFEQADILSRDPLEGWADVGICLEVLEHLSEPKLAVARLVSWSRDAAIFSVPWEPWFRLGNLVRGRHVLRLGNHPEHIQHYNPGSFAELLRHPKGSGTVETCFPWLVGTLRVGGKPEPAVA